MSDPYFHWTHRTVEDLARCVERDLPEAYQLRHISRLDVLERAGRAGLLEEIYRHLRSLSLTYDLSVAHTPDDPTRPIRRPATILQHGRASCLDLALVMAGMCLANELLPFVVLLDGHALLAVWLGGTLREAEQVGGVGAFDRGVLQRPAPLRAWAERPEEWALVECTGAARCEVGLDRAFPEGRRNRRGLIEFEAAIEAGEDQVRQHMLDPGALPGPAARAFVAALHIHELQERYGLRPLPAPAGGAPAPAEGAPGTMVRAQLDSYLDQLIKECQLLRLSRLTAERRSGDDRELIPNITMESVYTSLLTDGPEVTVRTYTGDLPRIRRCARRLLDLGARTPDHVAAPRVRFARLLADEGGRLRPLPVGQLAQVLEPTLAGEPWPERLALRLARPEMTTEAVARCSRLVLLGDPGAGKSTALRYLALQLASRRRHGGRALPGWPAGRPPVPVLLPLARVARALGKREGDALAITLDVLREIFESDGLRKGLGDFLTQALDSGDVLLLCDGLDEVPVVAADGSQPRMLISQALQELGRRLTKTGIVVTSRVRPYDAAPDWQLPADEGWQVRRIQPLALGQARDFIESWYDALVEEVGELHEDQARERARRLYREIEHDQRLRPMARSPLLLTMVAIVHYRTDGLPAERARLYEECVTLLLDRWNRVRQLPILTAGLIERLDIPGLNLDTLRPSIHAIAFKAHQQPPGDDGRGVVDGHAFEGQMLRFFKQISSLEADKKVEIFTEVLREDAGLLQEIDDHTYVFPHLTFQEYLAACHLADLGKLDEAYSCWRADPERWRDVLLLMAGRLRQQGPRAVGDLGVKWIQRLAFPERADGPKPPPERWRDLALAARSYEELGQRPQFAISIDNVDYNVHRPLREAALALLGAPEADLPWDEVLHIARVLGLVDDPRVPISPEEWSRATGALDAPDPASYWRPVPAGSYVVGAHGPGAQSRPARVERPFWVARLPVTRAQLELFIQEASGEGGAGLWTAEGRAWRAREERRRPQYWADLRHRPNQPAVGVTWYEAVAFARWVDSLVRQALPEGYAVRLPSDLEWEVALVGDGTQPPPLSGPRGEALAGPWRAICGLPQDEGPFPVGCCPLGASPCGALDMAGNIWEWTHSREQADSRARRPYARLDPDIPPTGSAVVRGEAYTARPETLTGLERDRQGVAGSYRTVGLRLVIGPRPE